MAPIEASISRPGSDDKFVGKSTPTGSKIVLADGLLIGHDGDGTGYYWVTRGDEWLSHGTLTRVGQEGRVVIREEEVPPIEKGGPPTVIKSTLTLKRT